MAIPKFIHLITPLPPLSSMVQLQSELPQAVIEPSDLRAAKASSFE
jgi:hypothetical protein